MALSSLLTIALCGCSELPSGGPGIDGDLAPPAFDKFADEAGVNYYLKWVEAEKNGRNSGEGASCDSDCSSDSAGTQTPAATEPTQIETNNQSAGVDEGDIIKFAGDRLVILRDQHLLILDIGGAHKERPLILSDKELDADFGAGTWGKGAWYDEMLVYDSQIILLAYRFRVQIDGAPANSQNAYTGAIEILKFNLSGDGSLDGGKRIFVESNDYYSGATNYATRKIGGKLIVYSPSFAARYVKDGDSYRMETALPYVLELVDASQKLFRRVRPAIDFKDIYRGSLASSGYTLHAVYSFDADGTLDEFKAGGVMGDYSRVYYATDEHLYLSIPKWWWHDAPDGSRHDMSVLYQFAIEDDVSLGNIAEIDGSVPERFAMDERDGILRLITHGYLAGRASMSVNAIAMDVESFGSVRMASVSTDGYQLTSTRFNGESAVTFPYRYAGQVSPLLVDFGGPAPVIRKSDISCPSIWMLQPYRDDMWIALGRNAKRTDYRVVTAIDVQVFEVGAKGELMSNASVSLDAGWTWSEAFFNDHAFFIDAENEIIGFPYSMWTAGSWRWENGIMYYSLAQKRLAQMGEGIIQTGEGCHECWYGNSRVVMRDGAYYNLLGRQIKVSAIDRDREIMSEISSEALFDPIAVAEVSEP